MFALVAHVVHTSPSVWTCSTPGMHDTNRMWVLSHYAAMLTAGMEVVHMTACNVSGRIRLSCDTRWQPSEDARDPRLTVWNSKQP